MDVCTIPAWGDNYIYLLISANGEALVVDPCDASLVSRKLQERGGTLTHILVTHHHADHVSGVAELKAHTGCRVLAADRKRVPAVDQVLRENETWTWQQLEVKVLSTPGHTRTSVCYYITGSAEPMVFTGDTLFVGGCGRLFECDGATMWQSLQQLNALPGETQVYCGHEYTQENLEFAQTILPGCPQIRQAAEQVEQQLQAGQATVPSTIGREKQHNVFLRAAEPEVQAAVGLSAVDTVQVFTELRKRKDRF